MIDKCIHVAKDPMIERAKITPKDTKPFELCPDCAYIWENDKKRNPAESEGYNVYISIDPDIPKNEWTRVNERPIPPSPDGKMRYKIPSTIPGATYYGYITTVNAIGLETEPSEVIKWDGGDDDLVIG